jgi:UDP-N-acetylglucosamine 2-epimerase (non-hydrolysing)
MLEEINRILTDQIADLLFTPSADGDDNLIKEGIPRHKIYRVGNVMIDSLVRILPTVSHSSIVEDMKLTDARYGILTMHRPSNVDDEITLKKLIRTIAVLGNAFTIVFPIHPRTRKQIKSLGIELGQGIQVKDPVGYIDFVQLMKHAQVVLTDSGGIQEETSYLGVPCLTLRHNTERPITVTLGTNSLVGQNMQLVKEKLKTLIESDSTLYPRQSREIPLWDGHAAERIVEVLKEHFG